MRIQLATPYKLPGTVGGISSHVETLRYSLSRAGIDVAVAREIDISSDVIHCHAHWYVLRDSLKRKKISGFTFHTVPELSYLKWKAFTKLLDKCKFLIHLSDYSLQEISRSTALDGHVIRPSVLPKFLPIEDVEELKTKLKLDSKHPILCMISPLEHKEKCEGLKSLLASLKLIESQGDPHLLVVGGGSRMIGLQKFAERENVKSKVSFLGGVPDVWELLSLCDIYTHISFKDNSPLAILEAMSIGKPVVSVDVGGIRELLGDEGILTGRSPVEVAETISRTAENPSAMKRVSEDLRRRFERTFRPERMARQHIRLYEEALR